MLRALYLCTTNLFLHCAKHQILPVLQTQGTACLFSQAGLPLSPGVHLTNTYGRHWTVTHLLAQAFYPWYPEE